jgi:hypothetical protein
MIVVLEMSMENLAWKILGEMNVHVNVTYDCCSRNEYGKSCVKNLEWDECSCECYIYDCCCSQSKYCGKILSQMNVYVNVIIYDYCSEWWVWKILREKSWVRWMFM